MDNNDNNEKKQRSGFKKFGLTTLSLIGGLAVAGSVIYFSNDLSKNTTDSTSGPLSYLLSTSASAGFSSDGSYGAKGLKGVSPIEGRSLFNKSADSCLANDNPLHADDIEIARTAWTYFEKNYNPETGFYNSATNYTSTTMWDTGSGIAATIAALNFGFIDRKGFDDRIMAMFKTLNTMELFNKEAPNKVYSTKTGKMVDYRNKPVPNGIGVSILDLGRLVSWLNTLQCMYPRYKISAEKTINRWNFDRLLRDGQMYGLAKDKVTEKIKVLQEGRLGYEQYVGKVFRNLGFDMHVASTYNNKFRSDIEIMDVSIAYDTRDPREFGANNYVLTESYTMDAQENGIDNENRQLIRNIFEVQKERWKRTGVVTAVTEDNIDRKPYFLYNSIFNAGIPWSTINPRGNSYGELKTVSTKAALSLAVLFPEEKYSEVLMETIHSAYSEEKGWYSGIYENGIGYNTTATANTNGNIMANMLYKKYGSFYELCSGCKRMMELDSKVIKQKEMPCNACAISASKTAKDNAAKQYARKETD